MVYTLETSWYDHTNIRIVDFHTCNIFMMKNGNIEKDVEINVSSLYYFHRSFPLLIVQSLDYSPLSGWPLTLICTLIHFLYWVSKCTAKCTDKVPIFGNILIKNALIFTIVKRCTHLWLYTDKKYWFLTMHT